MAKNNIFLIYVVIFVVIMASIYTYMYFTLPHLKEHFENMPTNKQDKRDESKNTFDKNKTEAKQEKSVSALYEYDLEKKVAIYVKFQSESDALKSYYTNLEKLYVKSGKDLAMMRETYSIERAKCTTMEKEYTKLKRNYEDLLKEQQASLVIEEQLKKQLSLIDSNHNPLAKTIQKKLDERQEQKKTTEKKIAEEASNVLQEYEIMNNLKLKLSKDEDSITKLKKQYDVMERQMAQLPSTTTNDIRFVNKVNQ